MHNSQELKSVKKLFRVSLLFTVLLAVSVFLFKPGSDLKLNHDNGFLSLFAGVLFWVSLLGSQILMGMVTAKRKKYNKAIGANPPSGLPAILTFFSNRRAKIADIFFIVCVAGFIVTAILSSEWLVFVFLSLSVLGFAAHCIANGKNLKYIKKLSAEGESE